MSKKIIIVISVILFGGYFLFEGTDILTPNTQIQTQSPRTLKKRDTHERATIEEPSESTTESGTLDFNEAHRFNSIEEIGEIRFTMTVGKVYRMQTNEYSYHGIGTSSGHTGGKVHIKHTSDPEYTTESKFLVQVGYPFAIGSAEGRNYLVTPIEVGSTVLKLRIEDITD